jgi:hypothetical protein
MPGRWLRSLDSGVVARLRRALLALLLVGLGLGGWPGLISPVAAQTDPFDAGSLTVNVELILDVSGSMAELIPGTDQTRMEAAQEALLAVIAQIPERPGLNVGLRVYGQAGSNLQSDQAVSCATTELLVPISGVDRGLLSQVVQGMQPTGWTPLARALEDASVDFAPGESVTNAVIMVTDGEETCGGDPCAVAGALHAAGIELTTHVVGFALTPEQHEAVRCIAEQGGGELFAADDAAGLSEAVFTAFSQVETSNVAGGTIAGNAFELLGPGAPGEISAVAAGLESETTLLLVARNNTGEMIENIEANVTAVRGETTIGPGTTIMTAPYVVEPGGVALLQVVFAEAIAPTDAFDIQFTSDPLGTTDPKIRGVMLLLDSVTPSDLGLDVVQRNPYSFSVYPNQFQFGMCFDGNGRPHHYLFDTTVVTEVPAGATAPELIADYRADECPFYLATTSGDPDVDFGEAPLLPPGMEGTAAPSPNPDAPTGETPEAAAASSGEGLPPTGAVVGTAFSGLGSGVPGELATVAAGLDGPDTLLLVIRNDTGAAVENVAVTATAGSGAATSAGSSLLTAPYVVEPGSVALTQIFFPNGGLTEQTEFTIDITSDPAGTTPPEDRFETDLEIQQIRLDNEGANLSVANPYSFTIGPNQFLYLMCFDNTGLPDHLAFDTEVLSEIPAGGTATIHLADARIETCPVFLAAVTGEPER